jgi:hypothetical protein
MLDYGSGANQPNFIETIKKLLAENISDLQMID